MRWMMKGVDRETGKERILDVGAGDQGRAEAIAQQRGLLIESVEAKMPLLNYALVGQGKAETVDADEKPIIVRGLDAIQAFVVTAFFVILYIAAGFWTLAGIVGGSSGATWPEVMAGLLRLISGLLFFILVAMIKLLNLKANGTRH